MNCVIKRNDTLQSQVYEYLRKKIIIGGLAPGQRLVEEKIAEETGVSRSPIREAIRRLEKDGLVLVKPHSGVTVYSPTLKDFQHLYECRLSLEPAAAKYAAERRTEEQIRELERLLGEMQKCSRSDAMVVHELNFAFHQLIAEASQNPYLIKIMNELKGLITFYRNAILRMYPKRPETVMNEHAAIFQAISDQDAERAERLMEEHIRKDYQLSLDAAEEITE